MLCHTDYKIMYCITGPNKPAFTHLRSTRIVRPSPQYKCWQFKALHTITFENKQDYDDIFTALNKNPTTDSLSENEVIKYISERYFAGKEFVIKDSLGGRLYPWLHNYSDRMSFSFYLLESKKEMTKPIKKEEEYWAKQKEIKTNDKLLETFFTNNLAPILEKYDLKLYQYKDSNANICFTNNTAFIKFVNEMITKTILNDIQQLGLKADLDQTAVSQMIKKCYDVGNFDLLQDGLIVNQENNI